MKKDILSWNDIKEKYLEFHKMDSFTENMAIDIDFGYWLVNNCIIPDVIKSVCHYCGKSVKPVYDEELKKDICPSCHAYWQTVL